MEAHRQLKSPPRTITSPTSQSIASAGDLARAASLFLAAFALLFVSYSRELPAGADEMVYFSVTQSMAKWQIVSIDQVSTVGPGPEEFGVGGHRYSKKGPLQSVLAVPLFWLAQRLPIGAVDTVLLLNHLVTACTVALFFLLVRRLGYSSGVAIGLATVVGFGTPLWVYAKGFLSEPTTTLCVVATIYATYVAAATRKQVWLILTGVAFGAAVATKNVNALLLLPVPVYLAWVWSRDPLAQTASEGGAGVPGWLRSSLFAIGWFSLGVAPIAASLMQYSYMRYGTPFSTGYGEWETFSTPVWEGVAGILFSPGKSIFIYTPLLLTVPFWAPSFVRRFRSFSLLLFAIVVLHLVTYGSWWVWWGAWGWGSRFTVPMLPLLVLLLAEGLATVRRLIDRAVVLTLGAMSVAVQALGVAVRYDVYLFELMALDPRPDVLTLYDFSRSPILNQFHLMTRDWLDFAWIRSTGPNEVDTVALGVALFGAGVALAGVLTVWNSRHWARVLTVLVATTVVAGTVLYNLRTYYRDGDSAIVATSNALSQAPPDAAVLHMTPSAVGHYANWQKRSLPELGWIEEPEPNPLILRRLEQFAERYAEIWVVTETPASVPTNGVEATLNRTLAQIGHESVGPFRVLRYATDPASLPVVHTSHHFADGIDLVGFVVDEASGATDHTLSVTLKWRASDKDAARPNYTVFVHVLNEKGELIAQHDGTPGDTYVPTNGWTAGQIVYDCHPLRIPASAALSELQVRVGLYLPESGQRASVLDENAVTIGDSVTIDPRGTIKR